MSGANDEASHSQCDPHGLVWHDGHLVSCDAGLHPGWNWQRGDQSPTAGYIFSIEIV